MAQLPPQRKLDPALKGPVEPGSPQGCTKLHPSPWAWGQGQGTKLGTPGLMLEAGQYIKSCWAIRSNQSGETGTSEIVASPNASTSEALPGTPSKKLVPGEGNTRRKGPQREGIRKPTHFLSPPTPQPEEEKEGDHRASRGPSHSSEHQQRKHRSSRGPSKGPAFLRAEERRTASELQQLTPQNRSLLAAEARPFPRWQVLIRWLGPITAARRGPRGTLEACKRPPYSLCSTQLIMFKKKEYVRDIKIINKK